MSLRNRLWYQLMLFTIFRIATGLLAYLVAIQLETLWSLIGPILLSVIWQGLYLNLNNTVNWRGKIELMAVGHLIKVVRTVEGVKGKTLGLLRLYVFLQGSLKVWKYPLPEYVEMDPIVGTFLKLPSNEPVNMLARVYVIKVNHVT